MRCAKIVREPEPKTQQPGNLFPRPLAVCRAVWWVDSPAAPVEKVM